jgi:hypothetical protein
MWRISMRAVIIQEVELVASKGGVPVDDVAELPNRVPLMRLETGAVVEAYNCHRYVAAGTEGEAEFNHWRQLWTFTPDAPLELEAEE